MDGWTGVSVVLPLCVITREIPDDGNSPMIEASHLLDISSPLVSACNLSDKRLLTLNCVEFDSSPATGSSSTAFCPKSVSNCAPQTRRRHNIAKMASKTIKN
jgi:hypothetical protein